MKLLTKQLIENLKKNKSNVKDPLVLVHYFNPVGRGNWFGITYNEKNDIMFGYVSLFGDWNDELGDFYLKELEDINLPLGLHIERELNWQPTPLSEVRAQYTVGR